MAGKSFSTGEDVDRTVGNAARAQVRERGKSGGVPAIICKSGDTLPEVLVRMYVGGTASNAVQFTLQGKPPRPVAGTFSVAFNSASESGPWYSVAYGNPRGDELGKMTLNLYDPDSQEAAHASAPGPTLEISGPALNIKVVKPAPAKLAAPAVEKVTMEEVARSTDAKSERGYEWGKDGDRFVPVHIGCGGDIDFATGVCERCEKKVSGWLTKEEKEAKEAGRKPRPTREQSTASRAPAPAVNVRVSETEKIARALLAQKPEARDRILSAMSSEQQQVVKAAMAKLQEPEKVAPAATHTPTLNTIGGRVLAKKDFCGVPVALVEFPATPLDGQALEAWIYLRGKPTDINGAVGVLANGGDLSTAYAALAEVLSVVPEERVVYPEVAGPVNGQMKEPELAAWDYLQANPGDVNGAAAILSEGSEDPEVIAAAFSDVAELLTIGEAKTRLLPTREEPSKSIVGAELAAWTHIKSNPGDLAGAIAILSNCGEVTPDLVRKVSALAAIPAKSVPFEVSPEDFRVNVAKDTPAKIDLTLPKDTAKPAWTNMDLALQIGEGLKGSAGHFIIVEAAKSWAGIYPLDDAAEYLVHLARQGLDEVAAAVPAVGAHYGEKPQKRDRSKNVLKIIVEEADKSGIAGKDLAAERPTAAAQPAAPAQASEPVDFSSLTTEELKKRVRYALKDAADQKYAREHFAGFSSAKEEDLVQMLEAWAKVLVQG